MDKPISDVYARGCASAPSAIWVVGGCSNARTEVCLALVARMSPLRLLLICMVIVFGCKEDLCRLMQIQVKISIVYSTLMMISNLLRILPVPMGMPLGLVAS